MLHMLPEKWSRNVFKLLVAILEKTSWVPVVTINSDALHHVTQSCNVVGDKAFIPRPSLFQQREAGWMSKQLGKGWRLSSWGKFLNINLKFSSAQNWQEGVRPRTQALPAYQEPGYEARVWSELADSFALEGEHLQPSQKWAILTLTGRLKVVKVGRSYSEFISYMENS